jgi:EAL domain-containing protein (putative c-di-GMP-specific phosphodiesterase class I)
MDDVGEGHSTLEILAAGAPEFIKIASSLTRSADQPGPRAVEVLVTFARSSGAIEAQADLDRMMELGAEFGQDFLLGRPALGGVHPDSSAAVPTAAVATAGGLLR